MKCKVFGIVPAAGRSRRMGAPKQLLTVGGRPMIVSVVSPLLAADLAGVIVVTHGAVAAALPGLGEAEILINDDPASEMIDSIRLAARHAAGQGASGFLVCPGDLPGLDAETVNACVHAFCAAQDRICVASHGGRRGHPIVFGADYLDLLFSPACDGGLRTLLQRHADAVVEVPTANPAIHRNVNTPEDYRRL